MSWVTDYILVTGDQDESTFGFVEHTELPFVQVNEISTPQSAAMQCDIYICAVYDHCGYSGSETIVREFKSWPWEFPGLAQLMTKEEHEYVFTTHTPRKV